MDGGFKALCDRLATADKITITEPEDPNVVEIPFDLESDITALVDMIKPKMKPGIEVKDGSPSGLR